MSTIESLVHWAPANMKLWMNVTQYSHLFVIV